jgi:lysophospholipase L1-like esterase
VNKQARSGLVLVCLVIGGVFLVLDIGIVVGGPAQSLAPSTTAPQLKVRVSSVAVLGDSLVFLSTGDLQRELGAHYPNPIIQSALGVGTAQMRLAIERLHSSTHPDAIVLALGTNDARFYEEGLTAEQKDAQLQNSLAQQAAVLQTLSDTPCVIWVGVQEHNAVLHLTTVGPLLNSGFKVNISSHANAHFLDWEAQMKPHPEWQAPDGLHFSDAGNAAYAAVIAQAVSQLC